MDINVAIEDAQPIDVAIEEVDVDINIGDEVTNISIEDAQPISVNMTEAQPINISMGEAVNLYAGSAVADKNFIYSFTNESALVVEHNLSKKPAVTVVDSSGEEVIGQVTHMDNSTVLITFTAPFTGKVILN